MRIAFGFLLILIVLGVQAQPNSAIAAFPGMSAAQLAGSRAANEPRKLTYYVVDRHTLTEKPDGDSPKIEFIFRDSVSGTVRQYFKSGKLKSIMSFAHIPRAIKHGVETTWSEDGRLLTRQEYQAGEAHGEFLSYFLDGKMERRITYAHDHIVSIECFNRQGQGKNCITEEVQPEYRGGVESLAANLLKLISYPPTDLQDNRTGTVLINFTVDTTGVICSPQALDNTLQSKYINASAILGSLKLSSPAPLGKPSQDMEATILRGLASVAKFRKPGRQEGRPVAVVMFLEVRFEIKKPGKGTIDVSVSERGRFPAYTQQH